MYIGLAIGVLGFLVLIVFWLFGLVFAHTWRIHKIAEQYWKDNPR